MTLISALRRQGARSVHRLGVAMGAPCPAAAGPATTFDDLVHRRRIVTGRHLFGKPTVHVHDGDVGRVFIGSYASIGKDVEIFVGGEHRTDWVTTYALRAILHLPGAFADGLPATKGDVAIGNDVWVGRGAKILSGVQIGDGAVVGAYSVVASSVRPFAIVVGNPARELRRRFPDELCDALQAIRWWEWPDELVAERAAWLSSPDVAAFVERFRPEAVDTTSAEQG